MKFTCKWPYWKSRDSERRLQLSQSSGKSDDCETETEEKLKQMSLPDTFYPNIHFAREESLRDPEGVEKCSGNVEEAHEDEPAQACLRDGSLPAILHSVVSSGRYPRQSKHDEDKSSIGAVSRGPELVPEADHHRQDAQHYHHGHVQHLQQSPVSKSKCKY